MMTRAASVKSVSMLRSGLDYDSSVLEVDHGSEGVVTGTWPAHRDPEFLTTLTQRFRQVSRQNALKPQRLPPHGWGRATISGGLARELTEPNGWPARSPADASPTPSRVPPHGSGPMWFAIPSSQWTLTTYSLPVSRRTPTFLVLSPMRFDHHDPVQRSCLVFFAHAETLTYIIVSFRNYHACQQRIFS
jgi:hypothetical protein